MVFLFVSVSIRCGQCSEVVMASTRVVSVASKWNSITHIIYTHLFLEGQSCLCTSSDQYP